jgi:hypothetical protein
MDPLEYQGIQAKLDEWLDQGYQVLADKVDDEIRVTCHFVPRAGEAGREREQEHWPRTPEVVQLLEERGVVISQTSLES